MDAQLLTLEARHRTSPRVARFVVAWLATVLAAGLWQGYGAWLLSSRGGNVF